MRFGLVVPQGWRLDLTVMDPAAQWPTMLEVARAAEASPFESIWVYDHFHTVPVPTLQATHEAWSLITLQRLWEPAVEIPIKAGARAHGGGDDLLLRDLFHGAANDRLGRAAGYQDGVRSVLVGSPSTAAWRRAGRYSSQSSVSADLGLGIVGHSERVRGYLRRRPPSPAGVRPYRGRQTEVLKMLQPPSTVRDAPVM
jgi:hypothetical protein